MSNKEPQVSQVPVLKLKSQWNWSNSLSSSNDVEYCIPIWGAYQVLCLYLYYANSQSVAGKQGKNNIK